MRQHHSQIPLETATLRCVAVHWGDIEEVRVKPERQSHVHLHVYCVFACRCCLAVQ